MPLPSDCLSWEFWAKDTLGLYHLAVIVGGAVGVLLLTIRTFAANRSARAAMNQAKTAADRHEEQTNSDRAQRITESFTKAGEQLGSEKLETRLSGIYSLERISRESERGQYRQYWPIMETLTAYVREHAPWPPRQASANPFVKPKDDAGREMASESTPAEKPENEAEQASSQVRPATDIQAILTVLGRRDEKARKQHTATRLDLTAVDLRGADLREAHLEGADLREAHLEGANLWFAHLEGANLMGAHLEGAYLAGVRLERVTLMGACLERTNLMGAHLEGAYLRTTIGLTQEQLNMASGDERTVPPDGLTWPMQWLAPTSEAQPDKPSNSWKHHK